MESLKSYIKKISTEYSLWIRQRQTLIDIRFDGIIPKITLNEKYENLIKFIIRIFTIAGFIMIFISLPYFMNIILSLILFTFEQILERVLFSFTSLFIHPIPNYDGDNWLGMGFLYREDDYEISILFNEPDNAKDVYSCIKAWNYNNDIDSENNIKLSFVLEEDGLTYTVYIYPNPDRKIAKEAFKEMEHERRLKGDRSEHKPLSLMVVMAKQFDLTGSTFEDFMTVFRKDSEYFLSAWYLINGNPSRLLDITPIKKNHLLICNRSELDPISVEFQHGQYVMNL